MSTAPVRRVPGRLIAPEPGWTTTADVVVVGSGIAGLTAALRLRGQVDKILVVTKDVLAAGSTQWAQGGIAAALGPGDTPEEHEQDGELSLTREGGHHRDRIAHAGGDATGAEIQRALIAAIEQAPEIEVVQHALA